MSIASLRLPVFVGCALLGLTCFAHAQMGAPGASSSSGGTSYNGNNYGSGGPNSGTGFSVNQGPISFEAWAPSEHNPAMLSMGFEGSHQLNQGGHNDDDLEDLSQTSSNLNSNPSGGGIDFSSWLTATGPGGGKHYGSGASLELGGELNHYQEENSLGTLQSNGGTNFNNGGNYNSGYGSSAGFWAGFYSGRRSSVEAEGWLGSHSGSIDIGDGGNKGGYPGNSIGYPANAGLW